MAFPHPFPRECIAAEVRHGKLDNPVEMAGDRSPCSGKVIMRVPTTARHLFFFFREQRQRVACWIILVPAHDSPHRPLQYSVT
jgi:hypothetical protein